MRWFWKVNVPWGEGGKREGVSVRHIGGVGGVRRSMRFRCVTEISDIWLDRLVNDCKKDDESPGVGAVGEETMKCERGSNG